MFVLYFFVATTQSRVSSQRMFPGGRNHAPRRNPTTGRERNAGLPSRHSVSGRERAKR